MKKSASESNEKIWRNQSRSPRTPKLFPYPPEKWNEEDSGVLGSWIIHFLMTILC